MMRIKNIVLTEDFIYHVIVVLILMIIQVEDNDLTEILNQIKRLDSFPYTHISYRIMLTVSLTVT